MKFKTSVANETVKALRLKLEEGMSAEEWVRVLVGWSLAEEHSD